MVRLVLYIPQRKSEAGSGYGQESLIGSGLFARQYLSHGSSSCHVGYIVSLRSLTRCVGRIISKGLLFSENLSKHDHRHGYAGHSARVCCLSRIAILMWFRGLADQSLTMSEKAIRLADSLDHREHQGSRPLPCGIAAHVQK